MNFQPVRSIAATLSVLIAVAASAGCASGAPRPDPAAAPFGCDDPSPRAGTVCALMRAKHPGLFPTGPATRGRT